MSTLLVPHAGHISEFAQGFTGTCTQTALEVCLACVEGRAPTQAHMVAITREMIAKGLCAANGAATLWAVAQEARDLGRGVALEWDYQEPLQADWHKALLDNAGLRPILMQVAVGMALIDAETQVRDEAQQLHYRIARKAAVPLGHADERACVGFSQKPVPLTNRKQGSSIAPEEESRSC